MTNIKWGFRMTYGICFLCVNLVHCIDSKAECPSVFFPFQLWRSYFHEYYQWGAGQRITNLWKATTNLVLGLRFPTPTCYKAFIDSGGPCWFQADSNIKKKSFVLELAATSFLL